MLCRAFSLVAVTSILAVTIRVGATITKKNNFLFSGVAEELPATVRVGLLLVLSTPNAMRYAHRPNHGALLLPYGKNFFLLKA